MPVTKPVSRERINALINCLRARNRFVWAAHIFGKWLEQQRQDASANLDPSWLNSWRYGGLLRDAGDHERAAEVFRELALAAQAGLTPVFFLKRSFDEWASCLDASGFHRSAQETRELGRRIATRQNREEDEKSDKLKSLPPSRLIEVVAGRISFGLSLEWDDDSDRFNLTVVDDFLTLRSRFRTVDTPGAWLEFEAKAPNEREPSYPHVAVCVRFPWNFSDSGQMELVLAQVNEMNVENAACSTCLEPESGQIAIRSRIGFAGYNDAFEPTSDFAVAQEEATLNMFAEVLGMALGWEKYVAELHTRLYSLPRAST